MKRKRKRREREGEESEDEQNILYLIFNLIIILSKYIMYFYQITPNRMHVRVIWVQFCFFFNSC